MYTIFTVPIVFYTPDYQTRSVIRPKKMSEKKFSKIIFFYDYESVTFPLDVNYISDETSLALYFIADERRLYV